MSKKALVAISFGTSYPQAQKAIQNVEQALATAIPDFDFFRAFTSRIIIRKLAQEQNLQIPTPAELMEQLAEQGYTDVVCQTLHVIPGIEYEKMKAELKIFAGRFERLIVGTPLLYQQEDYTVCAQAVLRHGPKLKEDEALILMGHGTEHFATAAYCQLEHAFRALGQNNVLVGTVEGFPDFSFVRKTLQEKLYRKVYLMPFMLVAGDHAQNDLAGAEEDSWKSVLEQDGYAVEARLTGLGELPEIAQLIVAHMQEAKRQ